MTLTRLLEIDGNFLSEDDLPSLTLAERLWIADGSPQKPWDLCRTLESILRACERRRLRYAPILLRRKRELQRGHWKPRPPSLLSRTPLAPAAVAPSPPHTAQAELPRAGCELCGHTGIVRSPDGRSGRACDCILRAYNLPRLPAADQLPANEVKRPVT